MKQSERVNYLIKTLLEENKEIKDIEIPNLLKEQKLFLRSLMNVRLPKPISKEFLQIQNEYLQSEIKQKGIVTLDSLRQVCDELYIWQGDITRLKVDAIVNAANTTLLGCFIPNHHCIDNAIHTYAGIQLRLECNQIILKQNHLEHTGVVKLTNAYNLPSTYILHTVGPIIHDKPTSKDCELLASCYNSCLHLAHQKGFGSIAFCCISTGEFHFPRELAAKIAIQCVKQFKKQYHSSIKVVFNVWKEIDLKIYQNLLLEE